MGCWRGSWFVALWMTVVSLLFIKAEGIGRWQRGNDSSSECREWHANSRDGIKHSTADMQYELSWSFCRVCCFCCGCWLIWDDLFAQQACDSQAATNHWWLIKRNSSCVWCRHLHWKEEKNCLTSWIEWLTILTASPDGGGSCLCSSFSRSEVSNLWLLSFYTSTVGLQDLYLTFVNEPNDLNEIKWIKLVENCHVDASNWLQLETDCTTAII